MKICNKCGEEKSYAGFHKDANKRDGLCTVCKVCKIKNSRDWAENNPDRVKKLGRESYDRIKSDPERYSKRLTYGRNWRRENPDKHAARESRRRARKLNATPVWLSGSQEAQIIRTFSLSKLMSDITGEPYEVDHIVPLQGKTVCGLHVPWNLRVIPASVNRSKGNRL